MPVGFTFWVLVYLTIGRHSLSPCMRSFLYFLLRTCSAEGSPILLKRWHSNVAPSTRTSAMSELVLSASPWPQCLLLICGTELDSRDHEFSPFQHLEIEVHNSIRPTPGPASLKSRSAQHGLTGGKKKSFSTSSPRSRVLFMLRMFSLFSCSHGF